MKNHVCSLFAGAGFAAGEGLDRAQEDKAKPEVYEDADIQLGGIVAGGGREMRHEQEINRVSRHHRNEALQKVHSSLFGHRNLKKQSAFRKTNVPHIRAAILAGNKLNAEC